MLFLSGLFLFIFLPAVLFLLSKMRGRGITAALVSASLLFYACEGQPWFLLPMAVTIVLDYVLAIKIASARGPGEKKLLLILSLTGSLGLLALFKYHRLLAETVGVDRLPSFFQHVLLPAGISFYTFQTISYVVDVYRGDAPAERNFLRFAGFVTFFPHLVAGPLTRHHQLIPQLRRLEDEGLRPRWREGIFLFAVGMCKKVILADRFGDSVNLLLLNPLSMGAVGAWAAALGYAFQIYFDFSGYSDMAIGLGRLFGIELPQNFRKPFLAKSPSDFWRRWHITLSQWLRDYLYIPLGGSRGGQARAAGAILITMGLGGLWHGASWTFALWGLYHAVLLILYHLTRGGWERLPLWLQRLLTGLLVVAGWSLFRAESFAQARIWMRQLVTGPFLPGLEQWAALLPLAGLSAIGFFVEGYFPNASEYPHFNEFDRNSQIALALLCVIAVLYVNHTSYFLYYRF